ncbi:hypothetical protein CVT26_011866 [Gymnopilus dilepis]|uniref:Uncharacterized protein n=1 Tax=Gymnopilus dilepis TaxID=231916 RepID=A0A409W5G6_9AGAR|nr:hypothetical protein CVT26_011866 [Gymnopilus dilepis]
MTKTQTARTKKVETTSAKKIQSRLPFGPTNGRVAKATASSSSSSAKAKTDILISIKPVFMNAIVQREKNHEFRKYLISHEVQRMWLYVSSPDQTLRYIATVSKGKRPGEVESEDGMGNADFNAGLKESKYAYEIKELYELKEPLSLASMKARYGETFPQRFSYVSTRMKEGIVLEDQIRLF